MLNSLKKNKITIISLVVFILLSSFSIWYYNTYVNSGKNKVVIISNNSSSSSSSSGKIVIDPPAPSPDESRFTASTEFKMPDIKKDDQSLLLAPEDVPSNAKLYNSSYYAFPADPLHGFNVSMDPLSGRFKYGKPDEYYCGPKSSFVPLTCADGMEYTYSDMIFIGDVINNRKSVSIYVLYFKDEDSAKKAIEKEMSYYTTNDDKCTNGLLISESKKVVTKIVVSQGGSNPEVAELSKQINLNYQNRTNAEFAFKCKIWN